MQRHRYRRLPLRLVVALVIAFLWLSPLHSGRYQHLEAGVGTTEFKKEESSQHPPAWLQAYLDFHHQHVYRDGLDWKLKPGTNYLVWRCHERGTCGGVGDRLNGILQGLYVSRWCLRRPAPISHILSSFAAMCTNRVFVIDWPDPFPLDHYLEPHLVRWNVTLSKPPDAVVSLLDDRHHALLKEPSGLPAGSIEYRNNLYVGDNGLATSQCMREYLRPFDETTTEWYRTAFEALFQWSETTIVAAQNLHSSGPYFGMHIRTGKGTTWMDPPRHAGESALGQFDACRQRLHKKCPLLPVYVAADHNGAKQLLRKWNSNDTKLDMNEQMEVYHVDKSTQMTDVATAYQNVWAELLVLVESDCLVMSHSKFSTLAATLQQSKCAVYFDDCEEPAVSNAMNSVPCRP